MKREVIVGLFAVFFMITSVSAFEFNGTVSDLDGSYLNNTHLNMTIYNASDQFTLVGSISAYSNASGWFNMTVDDSGGNEYMYDLEILHTNATYGHIQYVGQSIPTLPSDVFVSVAASGINFYLRPAGTINITAVNVSGHTIPFNYQVKDKRLGYAVAEAFDQDAMVTEAIVHVPADRNYSIMVFPNASMPGSADWSNFSSTLSYGQGTLEAYNATTSTFTKIMNMTMGWAHVTGYVNLSGPGFNFTGFDDFAIVPYLLEPGDMAHATYGTIPFNLSSFFDGVGGTDVYDVTTGFFNISLPSTVEDSSMILYAAAYNSSTYVGGFANISLDFSTYPTGQQFLLNFSNMYGLLGEQGNITLQTVTGGSRIVETNLQTFTLVNTTNGTLTNVFVHGEAEMDYSDAGVKAFTWMIDIGQESSSPTFSLPLLNYTGIDALNLYASGGGQQQYAPKSTTLSVTQILNNANITIKYFDPQVIGSNSSAIQIGMMTSNATCDVPSPSSSCFLGGGESVNFNPFAAVLGGGRLSFTMGTDDVKIIYSNADLLASGPPDALFEDSTGISDEGGSGFSAAMQFGSEGPKIYDFALIGITYSETAGSGLNDSAQVNMSIEILYDDTGAVIWNITANGTSGVDLGGNYSHYQARQGEWEYLLNGTVCHENADSVNITNPCYIDTTNNELWLRVPHFSQVGPSITGSVVATAASEESEESDSGGSSSSGSSSTTTTTTSTWTNTLVRSEEEFADMGLLAEQLREGHRVRLLINDEFHYVGVGDLTSTEATINVSSNPQSAVLAVGDSEDFDVDEDGTFDLRVTLNLISDSKAYLRLAPISEPVDSGDTEETPTTGAVVNTDQGEVASAGDQVSSGSPFVIVIFVLVFLAVGVGIGFLVLHFMNEKREEKGEKKIHLAMPKVFKWKPRANSKPPHLKK